ncbi:MAG: SsrA-binding protein SmpB [Armatimonadota bacterium]|nr:SsrA-binding protein SmpB [Armatimonadota bacterium]
MAKAHAKKQAGPPTISNRRARYDYELLDTYEAGIVLEGSEVKSVLAGKASLAGAFCRVEDNELWVHEMDIAPYDKASVYQPTRDRRRKLLLHRREISLLRRRAEEKGFSIIPIRMYFKNRRVKVEIAIARGKRQYDKRDKIEADAARREAREG